MNSKIAISAITLVAVVLGISALVPALANQVEPDGFQQPNGIPSISEECSECIDEFFEENQEIVAEFDECLADVEDSEDLEECLREFNEDFDEAFDEMFECFDDNACFPRENS